MGGKKKWIAGLIAAMPSSKRRAKRRRGVVLSAQGWQRLQVAQHQSEVANNGGVPYTIEDLSELTQLSPNTLSKVRACKAPVDRQTLEFYFKAFDLELTSADCTSPPATPKTSEPQLPEEPQITASISQQNWGEAVDVSIFHSRTEELETLSQWIRVDCCRLITLLGMGGIGKTALSVKLAQQIQDEFEFVIWRSLRNAPPLESLLEELVPFLSNRQQLEPDIGVLLQCLQNSRCLVILDNVETILQPEQQAGYCRPGYENYGELFRVVGESQHQSCLLLTSREKPSEIAMFEGPELLVRSLPIGGSLEMALALMDDQQLAGNAQQKQQLCQHYGCSPLALKITASAIRGLFDGDIAQFLAEETFIFNGVRRLLDRQFKRLSALERSIMYWLAIYRENSTIKELAACLIPSVSKADLMEALESLSWRSLIQKTRNSSRGQASQYTQQPVVMEFLTDQLVEQICTEILGAFPEQELGFKLCRTHAITLAKAKDYLRETQERLILQPIVDGLKATLASEANIAKHLTALLKALPGKLSLEIAYSAGNLLNLLRYLQVDLRGYDLSRLTIWQANFQGLNLQRVNFTESNLAGCVFTQTFAAIYVVVFSPDGSLLAAGGANGEIRLWDMQQYQPLLTIQAHANWVRGLAFSPDGSKLASCSSDGTVGLWTVAHGQCLHILQGHQNWVWQVQFSSDGEHLFSVSEDTTVKLWAVSTGQCLQTFVDHTDAVRALAYSSHQQVIASGGSDLVIKLWDASSGDYLRQLEGHTNWIQTLASSPTDPYLASSGADSTVKLWDISTGECIRTLEGHSGTVVAVAFSTDGRFLASSGSDFSVRLWDVHSGRCIQILLGHINTVMSVVFNPDNYYLVSASQDQTVKFWDIHRGKCLKTLMGYRNIIRSVAWCSLPDHLPTTTKSEFQVVSGSNDNLMRLWTLEGDVLTFPGHQGLVMSVACSPDGRMLLSGGADHTLRLWNIHTRQCLLTLRGHTKCVQDVCFSPNSRYPR